MKTPNKIKKSRKVTFSKNFPSDENPIYKKGESHFISAHNVKTLELEKFGKVEEIDYEKAIEAAKAKAKKVKQSSK